MAEASEPWVAPVQKIKWWSPMSCTKGAIAEVTNWWPKRIRLNYLQERGKPLIDAHEWGKDGKDAAEAAAQGTKSSWQKFLDMFDTTIYHKVNSIQNSYYDQYIYIPNWLYKYYIKEADRLNQKYEEIAELVASIDSSVPYLVYGGYALTFLTFITKIVPVFTSYVRARVDFSLRKTQEQAARSAWEEEIKKRQKDRPLLTEGTRSYLLIKEEQEFYKAYRERMGSVIQVKEFQEGDRPKVSSRVGNVAADAVAILAKVRLFWPTFLYVSYMSRTLRMITNLVSMNAEVERDHEKLIRRVLSVFGEVVIGAQNEFSLHRCQSILLTLGNLPNCVYLYLNSSDHTATLAGLGWWLLFYSSGSAALSGVQNGAEWATNLFCKACEAASAAASAFSPGNAMNLPPGEVIAPPAAAGGVHQYIGVRQPDGSISLAPIMQAPQSAGVRAEPTIASTFASTGLRDRFFDTQTADLAQDVLGQVGNLTQDVAQGVAQGAVAQTAAVAQEAVAQGGNVAPLSSPEGERTGGGFRIPGSLGHFLRPLFSNPEKREEDNVTLNNVFLDTFVRTVAGPDTRIPPIRDASLEGTLGITTAAVIRDGGLIAGQESLRQINQYAEMAIGKINALTPQARQTIERRTSPSEILQDLGMRGLDTGNLFEG